MPRASCKHERTHIGDARIYECCLNCGAVRRVDEIQPFGDAAWHTCVLCLLPGAPPLLPDTVSRSSQTRPK